MKNSLTNFLKVADAKHEINFHWPYVVLDPENNLFSIHLLLPHTSIPHCSSDADFEIIELNRLFQFLFVKPIKICERDN